jgi:hypothetical protein
VPANITFGGAARQRMRPAQVKIKPHLSLPLERR